MNPVSLNNTIHEVLEQAKITTKLAHILLLEQDYKVAAEITKAEIEAIDHAIAILSNKELNKAQPNEKLISVGEEMAKELRVHYGHRSPCINELIERWELERNYEKLKGFPNDKL